MSILSAIWANPWLLRFVSALFLLMSLTAAYLAWHHHVYQQGVEDTNEIRDIEAKKIADQYATALADANSKNQMRELALTNELSKESDQHLKDKKDAESKINNLLSDVRDSKLRLSVAISAAGRAKICASPAIGPGDNQSTITAELDGSTSEKLIQLTAEGDSAIRRLNACIDSYNSVREALN